MRARSPVPRLRARHRPGARSAPLLLAGALLCLAGCRATPEEEARRDVRWHISHGEYVEALRLAERRYRENPGDAGAARDYRMASVAALLDQGRRLAFQGELLEALERFREAENIAPEVPQVRHWLDSTLDKLADRWYERGLELAAQDDLQGAIEAYERALGFRPDEERAQQGLSRALLYLNYRLGMGEKYYDQGVRALNEYWLNRARSGFAYALKYHGELDRAERRKEQAEEMLADERAALARDLESKGQFAAARNEYRLALLLDPDHPDALEGLERAVREERAAEHLREAERRSLRGEFAAAEEELRKGRELSSAQTPSFDEAAIALEETRLASIYRQARALESDSRYEEAVAAYDRLLEQTPFFQDAIARRDTAKSFVEDAGRRYEEALAAEDPEERLQLLREIEVFWPEYRDVRERIVATQQELAAPPEAGGG